jgi:NMD protein affecting ribosome stability and mRNA decay
MRKQKYGPRKHRNRRLTSPADVTNRACPDCSASSSSALQALAGDDGGKDAKKSAIQAALDRVKHKKEQTSSTPKNTDNLTAEQQRLIAEADVRRQQKQSGNNN